MGQSGIENIREIGQLGRENTRKVAHRTQVISNHFGMNLKRIQSTYIEAPYLLRKAVKVHTNIGFQRYYE